MAMTQIVLTVAAGFLLLITAAAAVETDLWWVRIWDFPRLLITTIAIVALCICLLMLTGTHRLILVSLFLITIGWQVWRIYPYTPLATEEVRLFDTTTPDYAESCFRIFSLNVLQHNRDYQSTIDAINHYNPDIILLMETDKGWTSAMDDTLSSYPHRLEEPLDNLYGIALYSRLPLRNAEIRYLIRDDTPSIFAIVETQNGREFQFIGLHPRPPQVAQNTDMRDGEIARAAKYARQSDLPVLAMGDFNDVAWSHTSRMFKRLGGYLDPRIGRGFFATFPAKLPVFRWPLDHIFLTKEFAVANVKVLNNIGSDHLPITAEFCLEPHIGDALNEETPDAKQSDKQSADKMIDAAQEKSAAE